MPRINKQTKIDELQKKLAWYKLAIEEIAAFTFYQGREYERDNRLNGRLARLICQKTLEGKGWVTGMADYADFTPDKVEDSHISEPNELLAIAQGLLRH